MGTDQLGQAGDLNLLQYKPPGPVGAAFIQSLNPISLIMGPAGSGKTTGSVYKSLYHSRHHLPICNDGVIRCRTAVVRDTYRDLRKTTLATWHSFFPADAKETIHYEGGQDRPVRHQLGFDVLIKRPGFRAEKVKFDLDMQFGAIGEHDIESFTRGYEITFGWGNECDLLAANVLDALLGRTGRYPPRSDIAPGEMDWLARTFGTDEDGNPKVPQLVFGDMNPPDISHWSHERCVDEKDKWPNYRLFKQPSGLSDKAENRAGKSRGQYELEAKSEENWVRRYVHGEWGYLPNEKPVYPQFSLDRHVANEHMEADPAHPLLLGIDGGGSPACLISQMTPGMQWRWLDEVVTDPGTGPTRFAEAINEHLEARFPGCFIGQGYADPSSWYGADRETDEGNWIATVAMAIGFPLQPTETNEPGARQDAVRWYLTNFIDGETPRLLVNPHMKMSIGGFAAHYKLTKKSSEGQTDKLQVQKNNYSHIHDAGQYAGYGYGGKHLIMERSKKAARAINRGPQTALRAVVLKPKQSIFGV